MEFSCRMYMHAVASEWSSRNTSANQFVVIILAGENALARSMCQSAYGRRNVIYNVGRLPLPAIKALSPKRVDQATPL